MAAYLHHDILKSLRSKWSLGGCEGRRVKKQVVPLGQGEAVVDTDVLYAIKSKKRFSEKQWAYSRFRMIALEAIDKALNSQQKGKRIIVKMPIAAWAALIEMCKERG